MPVGWSDDNEDQPVKAVITGKKYSTKPMVTRVFFSCFLETVSNCVDELELEA